MNSLIYMIVAYAIVWILIFAYVFVIGNRVSALERELETLKETFKRAKEKGN